MSFYSVKQEKYVKSNVCHSCAIYGLDGTLWAASSGWKPFSEYDYMLEGLGDEKTVVKINELKIAEQVAGGNRNPSAAGVRLCG